MPDPRRMHPARLLCVPLLFVLLCLPAAAETWVTTEAATGLTTATNYGVPNSLAWTADGATLGLAYYDYTPKNWTYNTYSSSAWGTAVTINTISAQLSTTYATWARYVDLEYDAYGQPRVAYVHSGTNANTTDDRAYFAFSNGSGWTQKTADSAPSTGPVGLELNAAGTGAYVANFYNGSTEAVGYLSGTNYGTFNARTVDNNATSGRYSGDLVVDSSGKIWDAYSRNTYLYVKSSTDNGATWSTATNVDFATVAAYYASGALNGNQPAFAWIAGQSSGGDQLRLSTYSGSSWATETLALPSGVSRNSNAALAYYDGAAYLSYYDTANAVKLATNASGSWTYSDVATGLSSSSYPYSSLAISAAGQVALSYYSAGKLYVAFQQLGDEEEVPEPGSLLLLGVGVGVLALRRRRARR